MVSVDDFKATANQALYPLMPVNISCGMRQLWLFGQQSNPEQELVYCFKSIERGNNGLAATHHHCAFYLFSDKYNYSVFGTKPDGSQGIVKAETAHNGEQLANYIVEKGLGEVTASPEAINPNTGNRIRAWIWKVDHEALNKWCAERNIKNFNNVAMTAAAAVGGHG